MTAANTPDLRALVERQAIHDMLNRLRVHATGLRENSRYDPAKLSDLTNDDAVSYGGLIAEAADMIQALQHQLAEMEADQTAFDWLGEQRNLELSFYSPVYGDDDDQSEEWRVTQVTGSINDWEWLTVGRGETPAEALRKARSTLKDRGEGR